MTLTAEQEKILHPVRHLRLAAGLTQRQLADRVSVATNKAMSEQWISRVEKGLLGEDSDLSDIYTALHAIITVRHAEEGRDSWQEEVLFLKTNLYNAVCTWKTSSAWVEQNTEINNLLLSGSRASRNLGLYRLTQDWYLVQRFVAKHWLIDTAPVYDFMIETNMFTWRTADDFMKSLVSFTARKDNPVSLSLYAFCMMFKLHPYTIQRWASAHGPASAPLEPGVAASWPDGLRTALEAIGFPWDRVRFTGRETGTQRVVDPALDGSNND